MVRIILSLAVAASAYFGHWFLNAGSLVDLSTEAIIGGDFFVATTAQCFLDMNFSISGECAPTQGITGSLFAATVGLSVVSAVLGILGLLPVIGRLTSIVTVVAGVAAIATFGWIAKDLLTAADGQLGDFRWGAYATLVFGVLSVFAGMAGMRGHDE